MVQDDIDERRNCRYAIGKKKIPLLQMPQLYGVIAAPKDQEDVGCHAEHLIIF